MAIFKELIDDQLYLYMNGNLIYKKWLKTGQSIVFDVITYDKNTLVSIVESEGGPDKIDDSKYTK